MSPTARGDEPARRPALDYRPPDLVLAILGHVYEAHDPVEWLELIATYSTDRHPWRTVENVVYDLIAYGALHRVGKAGNSRTPDTRAVKPTALGRAWLQQEVHPLPRIRTEEQ